MFKVNNKDTTTTPLASPKNDLFLLILVHGLPISDDRTEIFWSIFGALADVIFFMNIK